MKWGKSIYILGNGQRIKYSNISYLCFTINTNSRLNLWENHLKCSKVWLNLSNPGPQVNAEHGINMWFAKTPIWMRLLRNTLRKPLNFIMSTTRLKVLWKLSRTMNFWRITVKLSNTANPAKKTSSPINPSACNNKQLKSLPKAPYFSKEPQRNTTIINESS